LTAARVEKELDEMERVLRSESLKTVTTTVHIAYSREQRQKLLETMQRMRKANEEMFVELHLEGREFSEERIIRAKAAHLWTVLLESSSKKTRGFGELPATQAQHVDRHVEKLLAIVVRLLQLCAPCGREQSWWASLRLAHGRRGRWVASK
jgi:hypothetical protein